MLHIDEMILRLPGMDAEESRRLGTEVAQHLAGRIPENLPARRLDTLEVKLSLSPGLDHSQMAEAIAGQIWRQVYSQAQEQSGTDG